MWPFKRGLNYADLQGAFREVCTRRPDAQFHSFTSNHIFDVTAEHRRQASIEPKQMRPAIPDAGIGRTGIPNAPALGDGFVLDFIDNIALSKRGPKQEDLETMSDSLLAAREVFASEVASKLLKLDRTIGREARARLTALAQRHTGIAPGR